MKNLLLIVLLFTANSSTSQQFAKTDSIRKPSPEIFTSGFIDVMNNGQVNASARFVRLSIGEPGALSFFPIISCCFTTSQKRKIS